MKVYKESFVMRIWGIFLIFVIGCSEKFVHPKGRYHGPEVIGGGHRVGIELSEARNTYISSDLLASPFVAYDRPSDTGYAIEFKYDYSLFSPLDLNVYAGPDRPVSLGLHWQIWGNPVRGANAGNFSVSARARYGLALITGEEVAADGVKREWIFSRYEVEYDISMGYRVSAPFLVYLGSYYIGMGMGGDGFIEGIRDRIDVEGTEKGMYLGAGYTLLPYEFKLSINKNWLKTNRYGNYQDLNFGLHLAVLF